MKFLSVVKNMNVTVNYWKWENGINFIKHFETIVLTIVL